MIYFFKAHWLILIMAAGVGLLFIYPHLYLHFIDRQYFLGVESLGSDAEEYYVARIQEVYDGHPFSGNVYFWEGKKNPYLQPPFPEVFMGYIGMFLGLSAVGADIFFKFLLGFGLSLLIYFLTLELFGEKKLAVLTAVFILLANSLVSIPDAAAVFSQKIENLQFLIYARPVNPSFSSLFLFGYLLFFLKSLKNPARIYVYISGLLLGLSFYVYLYVWTYLLAVNTAFLFFFLAKKDTRLVKKILAVSLVALFVAIPYFLYMYRTSLHPFYQETFERFGFFKTREPIVSKLAMAALAAMAVSFFMKLGNAKTVFFIPFFSALLVINHQLITGLNIVNDHFHWRIVTPMAIIALLSTFYFLALKLFGKKIMRGVWYMLIPFLFFTGFLVQYKSYAAQRGSLMADQRYGPLLYWLKKNITANSVILADERLSEMIPAYTKNNMYNSIYAVSSYLNPAERLEHNYFILLYLEGIRGDAVADYLRNNKDRTAYYLFGMKYRYESGCYACFPDDVNEGLAGHYKQFLQNNFLAMVKKYRVDYLVWDRKINSDWKFSEDGLEKLFESGGIIIYKI